ncbi:MAG TPA: RNA methyltransferase [Gemmataceae bacterium]|nr:RNA methyltransferase [Gemmataceae bacterium]
MDLTRCRIVLVRTHYPGNLGASARVMRNFGLTDLVLVDPVCSVNDLEARRMATHGLSVLDAARVVPDLGAAVADCMFTLATSGLAGGVVRETAVGTPQEKFPALLEAAQSGPVAVVFGPEPHGLSNAEVTRCHGLVHIPVDPAFPALNLAQSVAICCYELYRLSSANPGRQSGGESWTPGLASGVRQEPVASFADQERAFEHLREALAAVGFLFGTRADALMHAVRQMIGRAMPSPQEVKILHGLARQLLYVAGKREHPGDPGGVI